MRKLLLSLVAGILCVMAIAQQSQVIPLSAGETKLELKSVNPESFTLKTMIKELSFESQIDENGSFASLEVEGLIRPSNIGQANLPVISKLIEVPYGAEIQVVINGYDEEVINLNDLGIDLIKPTQPSYHKSTPIEEQFFVIDEAYYSTDELETTPLVITEINGIMRGVRFGRVEIRPYRYNPVENTLVVYNNLDFEIVFVNSNLVLTEEMKSKYYTPEFEGSYNTFLNYRTSNAKDAYADYSAPVKYVIVADRAFESTLEDFVNWKTAQGYNVIEAYTDVIGTTNTEIKTYLEGLYTSATPADPAPLYLLIIGDHSGSYSIPGFASTNGSDTHITDVYFATYDGAADYLPDLYYGRISAESITELQNALDKIVPYEKYTMPDPTYLDNCLMVAGTDATWAHMAGDATILYGIDNYFNLAHGFSNIYAYFYNYAAGPYNIMSSNAAAADADVNNKIASGVGFGNYTAHCDHDGWSDPAVRRSNIANWDNINEYPFLIGNCCLSFEYNQSDAFGEMLLYAEDEGAIGYIGTTNFSYWYEDVYWGIGVTAESNVTNANFDGHTYANTGLGVYDGVWHENGEPYSDWYYTGRQIIHKGNMAVDESSSTRKKYYWEIYHCVGDPSIMPYMAEPTALSLSFTNPDYGATSLTVTTEDYTYVAISKNNVLIDAKWSGAGTSVTLDVPAFNGEEYVVVGTKQNRSPYINESVIATPTIIPVADFSGTPTTIIAGETVAFTDLSDQAYTWSWNFGDGGTSTEVNPSYTYLTPGTYTVSLTVTNALGTDTETKVDYIVVNANTNPPVAEFSADVTTVMVGGTVNFTDLTENLPSSWDWSFEGGTPLSSTSQNPSIVYNSPGMYQVELTAYNAFGQDTETKSSYITVTLPTYCAAGATGTANEYISNFTCIDIDNDSGSSGYSDFTGESTDVLVGSSNAFSVTNTGAYATDQCLIWVDWNRDGDFDDTDESVFTSAAGTGPYTGNITVSPLATVGPVRVRIRIHDTDPSYGPNATSCGDSGYGEVEDYKFVVVDPSAPPAANFIADQTTVQEGTTVNFTDLTSNIPTSWDWSFPGGTPNTSTTQNPSIAYNTPGTYDVTLTATNALTNDVETKTGYITVTVAPDVIVEWNFGDNDAVSDAGIPANDGTKSIVGNSITDISYSNNINADGWANGNGTDNWEVDFTTAGYGSLKLSFEQMSDNTRSPRDFKVQYSTDGSSWSDLGINITLVEDTWNTTTDFNLPVACENQTNLYLRWIMTSDVSCNGGAVAENQTNKRSYMDNIVVTGLPIILPIPVADFSANQTNGCDNLTVNFTDLSTNTPTGWDWAFGDGGTSTSQNPSYTYNTPGTYSVTLDVTNASGSDTKTYTDLITIGTTPTVDAPANVSECDSYTLPVLANGDYYANTGGVNPIAVGTAITSDQTIYVYDANGSCTAENSFTIDITLTPTVDAPANVTECDSYTLPALANGDYYANTGGVNPIAVGTAITSDQTIYVYDANGSCTAENSFTVDITTTPTVDAPANVSECDSYTLPALANGDYYANTGGVNPIAVGTAITSDQTIYVYDANGSCTAENSFTIDITLTPTVDAPANVTECDSYTLPALANGDYYANTGGVSPIAVGTAITSDQTIYVYAANGSCTAENSFTIDITLTPTVDAPANVTECDSYTLPALANGDYYANTGGANPIAVGTAITSDQTIYVYAANGLCTAENSFTVDITTTPLVDAPANVTECDSYTLPVLANGDYYANTGGVNPIAVGTPITSNQTIYVYDANGSCTAENSFTVDITTTPTVDAPANVTECDSYTLPALANGDYYANTGGVNPVAVGTAITSDQTIYVYAANGSCTAENSFTIDITVTPTVDAPANVSECDSYTLPVLANGDYYANTGGVNPIAVGTAITSDQTIYVYDANGSCTAENSFTIDITLTPTVDAPANVSECDSYTLPVLANGDYYANTGGANPIAVGTAITSDQTIYVYAANGLCTAENSFDVTINSGFTVGMSSVDETFPGANDGSTTVTMIGGTAPFDGNWTPSGITNTSGSSMTLSGLTAGFYSVVVQDDNGCTATGGTTVNTLGAAPVASFSGDITNGCETLTVNFTDESANIPTSWAWDFGDGGTSAVQNPVHTYTTPGTYTVQLTVTNGGGSDFTEITNYITVDSNPLADAPSNVTECDSYTLPALTNGDYYANTGGVNSIAVGTVITTDQTIYVYAVNGSCNVENSFTVDITTTPIVDAPANVSECDSYTLPAIANGDYYANTGGVNPIAVGTAITSDQTIYVYAVNGSCNVENSFTVDVTTTPIVDAPANVSECDSYTLPAIANGDYYANTGGVNPIAVGTVITSDQTIYVYAANGSCTAENSFTIDITLTPTVDAPANVSECDSYTLPALTNGDYYANTGGVNPIAVGTPITSDQTIYVYAVNGSCNVENSFTVDITTTPTVDAPANVTECDSYTLPALANGDYYANTGGVSLIAVGTPITSDQTIYVYDANGSCTAENSFTIDITTTPIVDAPANVAECELYTLPALTNGDYYSTTGGVDPIAVGTPIISDQTIYVYAVNGSCNVENSFTVDITTTPTVDAPANVTECDSYTLPVLANGDYYANTGGANPIAVGTAIMSDQTIYVYAANGLCTAENSFTVDITTTPIVDVPANVAECESYILPALTNGDYYSTTGGVDPIAVGTVITSDQTIYVYAADGLCTAENSFDVTIHAGFTAIATAVDESVLGASDGSVTVVMTGGAAPFTGTWTPIGTTNSAGSSMTLNGLIGGYYSVIVEDANGCTATAGVTVNTLGSAPVADFIADEISGCDNLTVTFTDLSNNTPTSWAWTFGDGGTSTDQNPTYTYSTPGTYSVMLTATNGTGSDDITMTGYIVVGETPVLTMSMTQVTVLGNDGTATVDVVGGATPYDILWSNGGSDNLMTATALIPGTYCVNVTEANGCSATDCILVTQETVLNPPVADFSADVTTGCETLEVTFTDLSTNTPTSWAWTFGDGGTSTDQNPVYTYAAPGTYTVMLTATNADGSDDVTMTDYIIVGTIPVIDLTVNPASGATVADGSASVIVTDGTAPYTITWSTTDEGDVLSGLIPGNYSVMVVDALGCMDSEAFVVDFIDGIVINELVYSIYPNPTRNVVTVEFDGQVSDNIDIVDVLGQVVMTVNPSSDITKIDISRLQPGVYFVNILVGDKEYTNKLIVQ